MTKKVVQQHNTVQGDLIGGSKFVFDLSANAGSLKKTIQKFHSLIQQDDGLAEFVDRLNHYANKKDSGDVRGLESKLSEAGRAKYIRTAKLLKEEFTQKLFRYQFSNAAQNVFVHVLSAVHSTFINSVLPILFDDSLSPQKKDLAVGAAIQELVKFICSEVHECPLDLTMSEVQGMLYFLTGNCHIEWS